MTDNDTFLRGLLERWEVIKVPIRPSEKELQFYEKYVAKISKRENPEILILGSTPEFRDLGIKYGMKPVSVDLEQPIWEAMKHFMKERGEEEFLYCDWLKLPEDRKFDLIIGDGPLNMISKEQGVPFFDSVAKVIKDDGLIVQRIISFNENLSLEDFIKAMDDYRRMNFDINLYGYTVLIANNIGETDHPHLSQLEIFEQVLSKYLTKEELDEVIPFLLPFKINIPTRDDVKAMLDRHFEIEEVRESQGLGYWDMVVQYMFKKRAQ
ncbi:hypothetical protein ACFLT2_12790 [Acidobacteriota bacterium]